MSLLVPSALVAGLLVLVPLLLHLRRGEPAREESFPALRLLLDAGKDRVRILRLRELLLLLLRTGAIVVATLAAARWILPLGGAHEPPLDLVLVVDHGPLSGAVVDGVRLLDAQRALAHTLFAELGGHDRVWVLPASDPAHPLRPLSPDEARAALARIEPVRDSATVGAAVTRARALLAVRRGGREPGGAASGAPASTPAATPPRGGIVVLRPDGRRLAAEAGAGVFEVDPGIPLPANRGISRVVVQEGRPPRAGEPVEVRVQVRAQGGGEAGGEPVRLFENGALRGSSRTDAGGEARLVLPAPDGSGPLLRVELDPDALRLDDAVDLSLRIDPLPELRLEGSPGRWVEAALETLQEAGWIRLAPEGRRPPSPPWASRLPPGSGALLSEGVTLLLPPEDPVHLAAFHAVLDAVFPGGTPMRGVVEGGGPVHRVQAPPGPEVAEGVRVERRIRWTGGGVHVSPLLLLDDGVPLVVELPALPEGPREESGVVRLLAAPLVPGWSELPLSAAMVPLLDHLLRPPGTPALVVEFPAPAEPLPPLGVAEGWAGRALPPRDGREASPFLAWLLVVILLVEGWLSLARRAAPFTELETAPPS